MPRKVRRPATVIVSSRARRSRLLSWRVDQPFLDQPIDHPGDGGTIKGNQSRKSDLIDPGVGADGRKRRVLNGRKAVTRPLDLRQEHGHRDLLEAARQVAGHLIDCLHKPPPAQAQVDQYTDHQYTEQ